MFESMVERPYGNMYADEAAQAVVVANPNVYYEIPGGMSLGLANAFILSAAKRLAAKIAGVYSVVWSLSINCAANNQDLSGTIMKNGIAQLTMTCHSYNGAGVAKNCSISGCGVLRLNAGDVVSLCVANHTGANNITMEHADLTLVNIAP